MNIQEQIDKINVEISTLKQQRKKLENQFLSQKEISFEDKFRFWYKNAKGKTCEYLTYLKDECPTVYYYIENTDYDRNQKVDLLEKFPLIHYIANPEEITEEEIKEMKKFGKRELYKIAKELMKSNYTYVIWDW